MSRELKHELNLDFSFLSSFFRIEKSKKIEKLFQDWVSHIEKKNLFLSCFTNFVSRERERERGKKSSFTFFSSSNIVSMNLLLVHWSRNIFLLKLQNALEWPSSDKVGLCSHLFSKRKGGGDGVTQPFCPTTFIIHHLFCECNRRCSAMHTILLFLTSNI